MSNSDEAAQTRTRHARAGAPTVAQLRKEIDSGRTGDNVMGSDPAAAPLGTDEEAAGVPLSPEGIQAAYEAESARVIPPPSKRHFAGYPILALIIGAILIILIATLGRH